MHSIEKATQLVHGTPKLAASHRTCTRQYSFPSPSPNGTWCSMHHVHREDWLPTLRAWQVCQKCDVSSNPIDIPPRHASTEARPQAVLFIREDVALTSHARLALCLFTCESAIYFPRAQPLLTCERRGAKGFDCSAWDCSLAVPKVLLHSRCAARWRP